MMSYEKRSPALQDTDKMPFGKHKGVVLSEVPASYLLWAYENTDIKTSSPALYNYIHNSMDAIKMEMKNK